MFVQIIRVPNFTIDDILSSASSGSFDNLIPDDNISIDNNLITTIEKDCCWKCNEKIFLDPYKIPETINYIPYEHLTWLGEFCSLTHAIEYVNQLKIPEADRNKYIVNINHIYNPGFRPIITKFIKNCYSLQ